MNIALTNLGVPAPISASSAISPAQHRKLVDAAQQFEGMLLQEMLKPMREHGFCQDESDDKDDDGDFNDTLSTFATETMATAISKSGGLGIAKMVIEQVEKQKMAHSGLSSSGVSSRGGGAIPE